MASQKQRAEKWRTFMWIRFCPQLWQDTKPRLSALLIGLLLAILILALQIHYGVISGEVRPRLLAVFWPYTLLALSFVFYHLARTPWLISNKHLDTSADLKKENEQRETELQATIRTLRDKPQRSATDQNRFDKAKKSLLTFGTRTPIAVAALRYLLIHQSVTEYAPGSSGGGAMGPTGISSQDALWAYKACAGENLVTYKHESGERTYSIPLPMVSVLEQLLHEDAAFRDMAI